MRTFDEYNLVKDLIDDISKIVYHIILDEHRIQKGSVSLGIFKEKNSMIFSFFIHNYDHITISSYDEGDKYYLSLVKYLFSKISPFFKDETADQFNNHFEISNFDIKKHNNFDISYEDYKIYTESIRFGL